MDKITVKEFFVRLFEKVKHIDKKWIPAIALGAVAIIASVSVVIASVVDNGRNENRNNNTNNNSTNSSGLSDGWQATMPSGAGGEEPSYTPEQIAGAVDALADAIRKNGDKLKLKNPFAGIKLPTVNKNNKTTTTTTKPSGDKTTTEKPSSDKPSTDKPSAETTTSPVTEPPTQDPPVTEQPSSEPPAATVAPAE